MLKKILASLMMLAILTIALPLAANAQTRRCNSNKRQYYSRNYNRQVYYGNNYYGNTYNRPSFYRRHRNAINVGVATGAGALIGGIAGGRRGMAIGALSGAGAGALYTYVIKPKRSRYYR
jgi:hypothetical protein